MHVPRLFMLGLALSGVGDCGRTRTAPDPVILSLGDHQILRSEFQRHVAEMTRRGADPTVAPALLTSFLEERVLVLEARNRGLLKPGADPDEEKAAVETLLARALPQPEVTTAAVARYYEEHRDEFRRPERVTLRQILVNTENEARDLRRRLQKDPTLFEMLAQRQSRAPEASTGGLMGTFEPGQLPSDLEAPAFALASGATSDIIRSPLGFHVLRVEERQPAREHSLEESAPRIRNQLFREKTAQSVRVFVQQLLSRAKVNHEAALASRSVS
jgi:hypothetical protein